MAWQDNFGHKPLWCVGLGRHPWNVRLGLLADLLRHSDILSAYPPKADIPRAIAKRPLLTQSGHSLDYRDRLKLRRVVRQRHRDRGSLADRALDVQLAVMEVDQGFGDRQAQTPALLGQIGVAIDPGIRGIRTPG